MQLEKFVVIFVIGGFIGVLVLFAFVVATGQTFGQRCKAMGHTGVEFYECVDKLSKG